MVGVAMMIYLHRSPDIPVFDGSLARAAASGALLERPTASRLPVAPQASKPELESIRSSVDDPCRLVVQGRSGQILKVVVAIARAGGGSVHLDNGDIIGEFMSDAELTVPMSTIDSGLERVGTGAKVVGIFGGAAVAFERVTQRLYQANISSMAALRVRCLTAGGDPVSGARVALSRSAVPKSAASRVDDVYAFLSAGSHGVHVGSSDTSGSVTIWPVVPGEYCFDIALPGFRVIGEPSPDAHTLTAPGDDVTIVLDPYLVAAVRVDADDILSSRLSPPDPRRFPISGSASPRPKPNLMT
jgi:hypothetical protein